MTYEVFPEIPSEEEEWMNPGEVPDSRSGPWAFAASVSFSEFGILFSDGYNPAFWSADYDVFPWLKEIPDKAARVAHAFVVYSLWRMSQSPDAEFALPSEMLAPGYIPEFRVVLDDRSEPQAYSVFWRERYWLKDEE